MRQSLTLLLAFIGATLAQNSSDTIYKAESAWLGLTTDERIKIPIYTLEEKTIKNETTQEMETIMVAGTVIALLNVSDDATSVTGSVTDEGPGLVKHILEIKFESVSQSILLRWCP